MAINLSAQLMDLAKLRHFVAVAQLLSFARAAEQLHISQPGLSRSIQSIERLYEVRLLDRGRNGVELTTAGKALLPRAIDLLLSAESLGLEIDAISHGVSGTLSFGIGGGAAGVLLPEALIDLIPQFPKVEVSVTIGPYELLAARLAAGDDEFFMSRAGGWSPTDGSEVEIIGRSEPMLLVRPGHPLLDLPVVELAHLAPYSIMSTPEWHGMLAKLPHRREREALWSSIVLDEMTSLVSVAARTDSILVGSFSVSARGLVPLHLRAAVLDQPMLQADAGIFTSPNRTLSPAAALVVEALKVHAGMFLEQTVRR